MITGGSRGLGRAMAVACAASSAEVWIIGRNAVSLDAVSEMSDNIRPIELDISLDGAAARAFDIVVPDILILSAGASPKMAPVHQQTWNEFSNVWKTDVKSSFEFGSASLTKPMPQDGTVVTISSGAAIGGSFASGGYAGAKRMQWFLSGYFQREADDLSQSIRYLTILPKQQFRDTELGHAASSGYAARLGIPQEEFLSRFKDALTPEGFAEHVLQVLTEPEFAKGKTFAINGASGIEQMD